MARSKWEQKQLVGNQVYLSEQVLKKNKIANIGIGESGSIEENIP